MTNGTPAPTTTITLRDRLAGDAIGGIIRKRYGVGTPVDATNAQLAAREAFAIADQMLAEAAKAK